MTRYIEKRKFKRFSFSAPLLYTYLKSEMFFGATMQDFSQRGMFFETGYTINPGADILITIKNFPQCTCGYDFSCQYQANVRWCKTLPNTQAFYYLIGVRFYEPLPEQSWLEFCALTSDSEKLGCEAALIR